MDFLQLRRVFIYQVIFCLMDKFAFNTFTTTHRRNCHCLSSTSLSSLLNSWFKESFSSTFLKSLNAKRIDLFFFRDIYNLC